MSLQESVYLLSVTGFAAVSFCVEPAQGQFAHLPASDNLPHVTVLRWHGGCEAAYSFTHDDNRDDHLDIAAPALEARGLRGTFNVNPGFWTPGTRWAADYGALAALGHEIASHAMYHQYCVIRAAEDDPENLYFHSLAELEQDCSVARQLLDALQGRPSLSFTYPGGQHEPATEAVIQGHYISARLSTPDLNWNPSSPPQMHQLLAAHVGAGWSQAWGSYTHSSAKLAAYLDAALRHDGWVIEEYHDIEWPGYSALHGAAYLEHLDQVAALVAQARLWVAPQGDVARYIYERDAAVVTILFDTSAEISFRVDDQLDDGLFDMPLSVRIRVPRYWPQVVQATSGVTHWAAPTTRAGGQAWVDLEIVPGADPVTLQP